MLTTADEGYPWFLDRVSMPGGKDQDCEGIPSAYVPDEFPRVETDHDRGDGTGRPRVTWLSTLSNVTT